MGGAGAWLFVHAAMFEYVTRTGVRESVRERPPFFVFCFVFV